MSTLDAAYKATGEFRQLIFSAIEELQLGGACDTNGNGILYSPTQARRSILRSKEKLEKAITLIGAATCDREQQP